LIVEHGAFQSVEPIQTVTLVSPYVDSKISCIGICAPLSSLNFEDELPTYF